MDARQTCEGRLVGPTDPSANSSVEHPSGKAWPLASRLQMQMDCRWLAAVATELAAAAEGSTRRVAFIANLSSPGWLVRTDERAGRPVAHWQALQTQDLIQATEVAFITDFR